MPEPDGTNGTTQEVTTQQDTAQAAASPSVDAAASPASQRAPSFFERFFHIGSGRQEMSEGDAPETEDDASGDEASRPERAGQERTEAQSSTAGTQQAAQTKTLTLSEEELERRIQAEADRREQKRAARQGAAVRPDPVRELEQREREERKQDVYKAAETRDQIDALNAQREFLHGLGRAYDQMALDPIMLKLPKAEQERIVREAQAIDSPTGTGLEPRQHVASAALSAFEAAIRADERAKTEERIRKNPAVRKQTVLGVRSEPGGAQEPVMVAAGSARRNGATSEMDDLIRAAAGRRAGGGAMNPYRIGEDD